MNPDKLLETLQQNFRIGLGAATTLVEALPDPEKRDRFFEGLQSGAMDAQLQQWAEKGKLQEDEARRFVEETLAQVTGKQPGAADEANVTPAPVSIDIDEEDGSSDASPTGFATKSEAEYQQEIRALTAQIEALKAELGDAGTAIEAPPSAEN